MKLSICACRTCQLHLSKLSFATRTLFGQTCLILQMGSTKYQDAYFAPNKFGRMNSYDFITELGSIVPGLNSESIEIHDNHLKFFKHWLRKN